VTLPAEQAHQAVQGRRPRRRVQTRWATTPLTRSMAGHRLHVWLLWAAAAAVLAACPMMLSEPAMWVYLLDPELLALIVIVGIRYTRLEIALLWLQVRAHLSQPWRP